MIGSNKLRQGVRDHQSNRWIPAAFALMFMLNAYVPALTDRYGFCTIDGDGIRWVGVALFTASAALRLWPVYVLGHRFSGLVAVQSGHALVTGGVYGIIRHPSYLGLLIYWLGWDLAFRSWVGLLLTFLMVLLLLVRIRAEESLLAAHFGDEYEAYRSRTARLIPGVY
jgi:protein-S-isoprenylcysteine O-methyltransferase Ste14